MKTNELTPQYWSSRYREGATGWDIGSASPQLIDFARSFPKNARVLIPGCGHAYEAEALHKMGYREVYVADWSPEPLEHFSSRVPDFPKHHLLCIDFFDLEGPYDLVLEQTFYCALPPNRRDAYAEHMARIISSGGTLAGLLFDFPLSDDGPPFGGSEEEYRNRFARDFEIKRMERAPLSIAPRAGRELCFEAVRR
jgi:thiopurine S-methyltransferase